MERKTILLVEDDGVLRDLLKEALERQYNVIEASSCSSAIAQINHPMDLALIDYSLPDGDGLGVVKAIREAKPGLPIIMMTAFSTENLAIRALRSGVTDYMKKPFTFAYLAEKLSEMLGGDTGGGREGGEGKREILVMDCVGAFIEGNYAERLSLERLCRMTCMNKNKFSTAFKRRFGQNFRPYVNGIRNMKAAEMLLKSPDANIAEIAHSVGYGSVDHFVREFRKTFGVSPRSYRKNMYPETGVSGKAKP